MAISVRITGDGLDRFEAAVEALGSKAKAEAAYRMAINTSGKKLFTAVKRTVAKQMGASQARVVKYGHMRRIPASGGRLVTSVESKGGYLPLSDFKPRSTRKGASAAPWGTRRVFGGTFLIAKFGGNVFKRTGKFSPKSGRENAVEKLWGPAVPKEMVRDESEAAYQQIARDVLPNEIERQITRLTKGAVT